MLMLTRVFSTDFANSDDWKASKCARVRMSGNVYLPRPSPCLSLFHQAFDRLTMCSLLLNVPTLNRRDTQSRVKKKRQ